MKQLGHWISNKTAKPFYARKEFAVKGIVKKATAYVCGLGQFVFSINNKKVGEHELDPGWTNYDKLVQYVEFDVTSLLNRGRNGIGIEVGNGWYHMDRERYYMSMPPQTPDFAFLPPNPTPYKPFSRYLTLTFKLIIQYQSGEEEVILSDESWKTCGHYVTLANVFGSEIIDGRKKEEGFSKAGFEDKHWELALLLDKEDIPKGELVPQEQPPIKVKTSYEGNYMHTLKKRMIYDFTQNMSGILEFEVRGKKGDVINIYPAEKLDADGDVDQIAKGWTPIDVCISYIIGEDGQWETCRMVFTYFAGRYIAIEGAVREENTALLKERSKEKISKMPVIRNIKSDFISSDSKDIGEFNCDDRRLEQIYDLVLKSVDSNLMSVHTDCPTIERYAWQEQNHLMAPSIMYMKDVKKLWEKIFKDLRMDQYTSEEYFDLGKGDKYYPGEGMVPSQAPCYEHNVLPAPGLGSFFDTIAWGSNCILGVNWHYLFYGDKKVIQDNYETGMKYLKYLKTKVNEEGFINHGLGDWGNPNKEALARENVETAFLYANTKTLAKFASILKKEEDRKELLAYAQSIKENYNKKLLVKHPKKEFYCYQTWEHKEEKDIFLTQAGHALPLYWGLVPKDKEEDVKKAFQYIVERDQTFISGEIGLPYIIQTMSNLDMQDTIIEFILKEEHPSYYAFVLAGETTLGEYWEDNPRSHNHVMMGHIIEWYYNGIGGIKPVKPGFKEVIIKPYLPTTVKEFSCFYQSVYGTINVKVKDEDSKVTLKASIPKDVEYSIDDSLLRKRCNQVDVNIVKK